MMKRYCGHRYDGSLSYYMGQLTFKDEFLADVAIIKEIIKHAYRTHDLSKLNDVGNSFIATYCPKSLGKTFTYDIKEKLI